jgi:hypothetical protein
MENNTILYKLLHYILHEINDNIEIFYKKYSDEFNQSFKEFKTKGETLKQYDIYIKYEKMIEYDLEKFCKQENYDSIEYLYHEIKKLVENKKVEVNDINIPEDNLLASLLEPSANDILDIILDLSSYTTFSTIMRNKIVLDNILCSDDSSDEDNESTVEEDNDSSDEDNESTVEEDNDSSDYKEDNESAVEEDKDSSYYKEDNESEKDLPDIKRKLQINNYIN